MAAVDQLIDQKLLIAVTLLMTIFLINRLACHKIVKTVHYNFPELK